MVQDLKAAPGDVVAGKNPEMVQTGHGTSRREGVCGCILVPVSFSRHPHLSINASPDDLI